MGKQESSYEVHARFDTAMHADILLYQQATGDWNYHLRLCDGKCCGFDCYVITASQKPGPGNAPSIQIAFAVDHCVYHNDCVNVFVINPTPKQLFSTEAKYVTLLNFLYPIMEERKFFTLLQGSIGDLILFAKGQLVEGLFVDADSFRSSTIEYKPSVLFKYSFSKKGLPSFVNMLSKKLVPANPPIIIHCENPPGRASIEYGRFYSGIGDFHLEHRHLADGGSSKTIELKNVPVADGMHIPQEIFESWITCRDHESGIIMLRGELSKKYTVEIHGSMGSITRVKGSTG